MQTIVLRVLQYLFLKYCVHKYMLVSPGDESTLEHRNSAVRVAGAVTLIDCLGIS